MSIHRVSENSIERQFTAKALIGKDVYDNSNKKVGEVRDIVLDSSRAPQLATALSMRSGSRSSGLSGSDINAAGAAGANSHTGSATTGDASANGVTGSGLASTGSTGTGTGSTRTPTGSDNMNSSASDLASGFGSLGGEPAAIISYGGFMGAGGTLFRVPLSQLRYDSSKDHIALNVSDNELSSLKNSDTSRGAAE